VMEGASILPPIFTRKQLICVSPYPSARGRKLAPVASKASKGSGGAVGKVDNAHRLNSLCSLSRVAEMGPCQSRPCTPLTGVCTELSELSNNQVTGTRSYSDGYAINQTYLFSPSTGESPDAVLSSVGKWGLLVQRSPDMKVQTIRTI
jgi:hypothetical protein